MNKLNYLLLSLIVIIGFSCQSPNSKKENDETDSTGMTGMDKDVMKEAGAAETYSYPMEKNGLKISPVESPKFPDAKLTLLEPKDGEQLQPGKIKFKFNIENYELGVQTSDAADKMMANSDKGQHIHFIVDNGPYNAFYATEFEQELEPGQHVILAFPSRSYHESVKSTHVLKSFMVGNGEKENIDLSGPLMFYSRPKGTYSGEDTKKILLDWYLVNTDLSKDGNKVRATINGTEFIFTKWQPYAIEGAKGDSLTIKLELIDKDGNLIKNRFNPVTRTVTLEGNENM